MRGPAQFLAGGSCSGGENSLSYRELPGQELQTHSPSAEASHRLVLFSGYCGFSNLNLNVFRRGHASPRGPETPSPHTFKKKFHISLYSVGPKAIVADYIFPKRLQLHLHSMCSSCGETCIHSPPIERWGLFSPLESGLTCDYSIRSSV